jgi:hypothetical protein
MLPYKHYAASEIETAIEVLPQADQHHQAEDSTARRWRKEVHLWLLLASAWMQEQLGILVKSATLAEFKELLLQHFPDSLTLFSTILEFVFWLSHPLSL